MINTPKRYRRSFTASFKSAIVQEALSGIDSQSAISRKHDVNSNQLSRWIREYQQGFRWARSVDQSSSFLPVVATSDVNADSATEIIYPATTSGQDISISVDLKSGHRLAISEGNTMVLKVLLEMLA